MRHTNKQLVAQAEKWLGCLGGKFCSDYGMAFGNDWCCAFLWDVFKMEGASDLFCGGLKTAYVPTVQIWCEANLPRISADKAQPGDIIIMTWTGKTRDHIGMIYKPTEGNNVYTVEGNTGNPNNKKSTVMNRVRSKSQVYAIYRPKYDKHSDRWHFRKALKDIAKYMDDHDFRYEQSWRKNALTWNGAKKKRTTNCSLYIKYALEKAGLLKATQYFWGNGDKIVYIGVGTKKRLKEIAVITHPHKSPDKADLKKDDICCYKDPAHTQAFAGWRKGKPKWYSEGGNADIQKGKAHIKKKYNDKMICTKITLK